MSIVVAGWIEFEPEKVEALIRDAHPFILESLKEKGCREYAWSLDPNHAGRVRVFELWDSEEDLAAHFHHPSFQAMREHLRSRATRLRSEIIKYRTDLSGPVFDKAGNHRADFFTE